MKKSSTLAKDVKRSVLLLPSIFMLLAFFASPIFLTVYYSFTNLALTGEGAANPVFIGLSNYMTMFRDRYVITAIFNTLVFLLGCLIGQQVLGFTIALMMRSCGTRFRRVVGAIVLAGWVTPEIVVALCCTTFFGDFGTVNAILIFFGADPVSWLYEWAMLTVILANVWHGTAFSMMNFQSGLDNIPSDIEEAARVDGASRLQTLTQIIIPCLKGTIGTNTILNILSTLGVFGLIFAMTGGGPGTRTLTLPVQMYRQAFVSHQLGYGTAISMLLLSIGVFCSVLYTRFIKD
jgi:multiple sugar transport system permease protein